MRIPRALATAVLAAGLVAAPIVTAGTAQAHEDGTWVGPYLTFDECQADRAQDIRSSGQVCQPMPHGWYYFINVL